MTECWWLPCPECGMSCPDYNGDGDPDDGFWHEASCSHLVGESHPFESHPSRATT